MGDSFYEDDEGKKSDCEHDWERNPKTKRDKQYYRDIWFRKCIKCKQKQVGVSWSGYQQHGIYWFDEEDDSMQYLLKRLEIQ